MADLSVHCGLTRRRIAMAKDAKKGRKSKDLDAKARASKIKGGQSVWEDNRHVVPLNEDVEKLVVKPVQRSGKMLQKGLGR
jgi:hypothetical protein